MLVALASCLAGACAPLHMGSSDDDEWPTLLASAQSHAVHGEFDAADSLLANYAARHPGTPQALETAYWRGLFRVDPSNRSGSLAQGLASLDGYLSDSRPRQHVAEATILRRAAGQLEALNKAAAAAALQAKEAANAAAAAKNVAADAKSDAKTADAGASAAVEAKDAEIKRLKDDLAKANAELDRIRKRLSPSKPPPR